MLAPPDTSHRASRFASNGLLNELEWQNYELEDRAEALDALLSESAHEGLVLSERNEELEEETELLRESVAVPGEEEVEVRRLSLAVGSFDTEISNLLEERVQFSERLEMLQRDHEELYVRTFASDSGVSPQRYHKMRSGSSDLQQDQLELEAAEEENKTAEKKMKLKEFATHRERWYSHLERNVEALHDTFDALQEEAAQQWAECQHMEEEMIESLVSAQELRFEMNALDDLLGAQWLGERALPGESIRNFRMTLNHSDDTQPDEELSEEADALRAQLAALREQERLEGIAGDAVELWQEREELELSERQLRARCHRLERDEQLAKRQAEQHLRQLRKAEGVGRLAVVAQEERAKVATYLEKEREAADGREVELVRTLQALMQLDQELTLTPLV